jgi:hypothetical protein
MTGHDVLSKVESGVRMAKPNGGPLPCMIIKITDETGDVSNSREIINHNPLLCMPPRPSQNNCQRMLKMSVFFFIPCIKGCDGLIIK